MPATTVKYRVALISSEYPPHVCGGLGVHVNQITATLGNYIAYKLFVPKRGDYVQLQSAIDLQEVDVPDASSELEFWLRFCQTVAVTAEQSLISTDFVHCHDWMTIMAGIKLRQVLRVPLVFNVHLPEHIGSRLCLENLGLVSADAVIVNSYAVRQELMARELPIRHIEVMPNGVDLETFRPAPGQPADDGYILFVGRLAAQKGLDCLLQAFGVILHQWPQSQLVIVGDGDLELYYKRVVRYLGFPHRVSFINWQTGPALIRLYQMAQVVVMPSYYEPFGIVALEAMACGRPIIASKVGGLAEIIEDGVQGYLVPAGDYLELARCLSGLILDPKRRQQMGEAGRVRATQFSWDNVGAKTMDLYKSLIGKPIQANSKKIIFDVSQNLLAGIDQDLKSLVSELLGVS